MKNKLKMSFGIGAPSILMIFVSLCITVLTALSLLTVNANYNLANKSADYVKSYYAADSAAEEWLCETYQNLNKDIAPENNVYIAPITNNQSLEVTIDIRGKDFEIISQKIILNNEWDYTKFEPNFSDIKD